MSFVVGCLLTLILSGCFPMVWSYALRGAQTSPTNAIATRRRFKYISYDRMHEHLQKLADMFPQFTHLTSAQKEYDLPPAGMCGHSACEQYILRVTDEATLPHSGQLDERPEVFFSGALHGDERIGPTTTLEAMRLLTVLAACVESSSSSSSESRLPWLERDPKLASQLCAGLLDPSDEATVQAGSTASNGRNSASLLRRRRLLWMHRLVVTRSTIIMPAANALGYYQSRRLEGSRDPNRDFPFVQEPNSCFQTVTARALNEMFREHLFQLAITFHGGMQAIAYEWGSPIHPKANHHDVSPDDTSQAQLASSLSMYGGAGKFSRGRYYPHRPMNSLVYPVHGGMEDWAYAASWELKDHPGASGRPTVKPCSVSPGGSHNGGTKGYPKSKSIYTPSMLRIINLLVETSDEKKPSESMLGSAEAVFLPGVGDEDGNGHVARNVRLVLETIDMVQPYVLWDLDGFSEATAPLPSSGEGDVDSSVWFRVPPRYASFPGGWLWSRSITVAMDPFQVNEGTKFAHVAWRVGGALRVDNTELLVGCWPSEELEDFGADAMAISEASRGNSEAAAMDAWRRIMDAHQKLDVSSFSSISTGTRSAIRVAASPSSGHTRWSNPGNDDGQLFKSTVLSGHLQSADLAARDGSGSTSCNGMYFAMARATVDSSWGSAPINGQPSGTPPQSHFANARTNLDWSHEVNGHVVQGRTSWFSPPIKITAKTHGIHRAILARSSGDSEISHQRVITNDLHVNNDEGSKERYSKINTKPRYMYYLQQSICVFTVGLMLAVIKGIASRGADGP